MWDYIVYYPYKKEVDGCKNIDDIKSKKVFEPQKNQTSEDKYQKADILVWTSEGEALRHIDATMKHVYDSFTFLINIKWTLDPIKEEIPYQPMQETLKNFKILYHFKEEEKDSTIILFDNDDATKNILYRDTDGCYRYLLTSGEKGTITWQYTYRNTTFRGERDINAGTSGTRYLNHETADMGKLPGPNMQISDFYCSRGNKGYVLPWDAADRINEMSKKIEKEVCFDGRHCIGIVVGVEQHENDFSDYSECGIYAASEIKEKRCHGYVMSLTDSGAQLGWAKEGAPGQKNLVVTYKHIAPDRAVYDWNGFYNYQKIEEYISNSTTPTSLEDFPAENACRNYGYDCGLSAPGNTTGWFLPSAGMIDFVLREKEDIETAWMSYKMPALLAERFATIITYIDYNNDPVYYAGQYSYKDKIKGLDSDWSYWTSNEVYANTTGTNAYIINIEKCITNPKRNLTSSQPTRPITVRPFLAF